MRVSFFRAAAVAALAAALGACLGGGSAPAELLTLTPAQVAPAGTARSENAVTVMTPSVPQSGSNRRIPVYVSPTIIQYLPEATWVEEPRYLFQRLLAETVVARTGRLVLNPDVYNQVPGPTLSGQLLQFGLDPVRREVVVSFEAALATSSSAVRSRRFEARVPVAAETTATVAPALNQAANQVAAEVADWIGG